MNKLSAVIITKNEEANIERCLKSLAWVDEIVVVDSYSSDNTVSICKAGGCRVIETEWKGFGLMKAFAVDSASHNWILSVDADEEITEELKNDIVEVLENPQHAGYNIKRKSFYIGKMINHCGWNSDFPLRLFNRAHGNFNSKTVHESVELSGTRGKLFTPIYHYTYPSISIHLNKINRYTDLSSAELIAGGKRYSIFTSLFFGINKFLKMYFLKLGFLDGKAGLILCINSAFGIYLKYAKTWKRK